MRIQHVYTEKKLFLKVNTEKTVVAHAGKIKFPGYGVYKGRKGFRPRLHAKTKDKMKVKIKQLTSRRNVQSYEEWKRKLKRFVSWLDEILQTG